MKMTKVLAALISTIMIVLVMPQSILAADSEALDTALGSLADKGQKYITDGTLPASVEIEGESYEVTYISDNEVITSDGTVNHGYNVVNVTVTPQIMVAGEVVMGTAQSLVVLPDANLLNATFFEDFEGSEFDYTEDDKFVPDTADPEVFAKKLESQTAYGKWTTGVLNDNSEISIQTDATKYIKIRMASPGTSSSHTQPYIDAPLDEKIMASDMVVLSMRFKNYLGGSNAAINIYPFFNVKRGAIYNNIFYANVEGSETASVNMGDCTLWNDVVAIRMKGADPKDTTTEVFVNGKSVGSFKGELNITNLFRIYVQRANENPTCLDDIYVAGMDLPDITLGDIGNLVTSDVFPQSIEGCPLIYESSNVDVITSNGMVNRGFSPEFVTVTPIVDLNGAEVRLASQNLVVMPKGDIEIVEDFDGDEFKPESGETEKVFEAGSTVNGWIINTIEDKHTAKAVDDERKSRYFSMRVDDCSYSHQPTIYKDVDTTQKSISVVAFSSKVNITRTGPLFNVNPYVSFASTSPNSTLSVQSGEVAETTVSQGVWHDFVVIRKNAANVENTVTDIYMDGSKLATLKGDNAIANKNRVEFYLNRGSGNGNTYLIDNIVVMNVDFSVDIKVADRGNSYVTGNKLAETVLVDGVEGTVTYESSNENVIDSEGNVTHGDSFTYVDVTPVITLMGNQYNGSLQTVLVMPKSYDEALFEDFESFNEGSLINESYAQPNGWRMGNKYDSAYDEYVDLNIDRDKAHGKYFRLEIEKANAVANPIFRKTFEDKENGKTLIAFSANINPYYSALNKEIRIFPIGEFATTFLKGGNDLQFYSIYKTKTWQNFLFVVDNDETLKNGNEIYKKADIYVDGVLKAEDYYFTNWISALEFSAWRGAAQSILVDDIVVAHIDESDFIVSDIKQTNEALTGFKVRKMDSSASDAMAFAAIYDENGKLTASDAFELNFTDGEAVVAEESVLFNGGKTMKLFVWTEELSLAALVTERVLMKDIPEIYLLGDSSVCNWTTTDKRGWGTYLQEEFEDGSVAVHNHAVSGERSDTFMERYFSAVEENLGSGDFLFIQFGNNDHGYSVEVDTYKSYLRQYIDIARRKGAYPVLVSPITRKQDADGLIDMQSVGLKLWLDDYAAAMESVALEKDVPFLNMRALMKEAYKTDSTLYASYYVSDGVHFNETGARVVAGFVADCIKNASPKLYIADKLK